MSLTLENVTDFSKVCRVCAACTDMVMPIFSGEGYQNGIDEKINKYLPIRVSKTDSPQMPVVVCFQCATTLMATHELAACSEQADEALRMRSSALALARRVAKNKESSSKKLKKLGVRRCPFCSAAPGAARYAAHLRARHLARLFECEECASPVARRDFLEHMTAHAADLADAAAPETEGAADLEFSDDEDTFEPLPASVFTAIEDSEDARVVEPPQAPERPSRAPQEAAQVPQIPAAVPEIPQAVPEVPKDTEIPLQAPQQAIDPPQTSNDPGVSGNPPGASNGGTQAKNKMRACPHCDKTFTASSSYFYHIKYFHRRSREHGCAECGSRFGTRAALREHASLHTGERARECEQCHKMFRSKASLYIHRQTHGTVKKYTCGVCGSGFRWKTQLQRHADAREHACGRCGRAFSVRGDMLRHERTHARAAHGCPVAPCPATFAQPRYLRTHLSKKHSGAARGATLVVGGYTK